MEDERCGYLVIRGDAFVDTIDDVDVLAVVHWFLSSGWDIEGEEESGGDEERDAWEFLRSRFSVVGIGILAVLEEERLEKKEGIMVNGCCSFVSLSAVECVQNYGFCDRSQSMIGIRSRCSDLFLRFLCTSLIVNVKVSFFLDFSKIAVQSPCKPGTDFPQ